MEDNLYEQMAHLIDAKMPLPVGLRQLAKTRPRGKRRTQLENIAEGIEAGQPVGRALQEGLADLDPGVSHLLSTSASSGHLAGILFELANHEAAERRFIGHLREMIAYPLFTILLAAGLALLLYVPIGSSVMVHLNYHDLSHASNMPMYVFEILQATQPLLILGWGFAALVLLLLLFGGRFTAGWLLGLAGLFPSMRRVMIFLDSSRIARLLSRTTSSRLPLADALHALSRMCNARNVRRALASAAALGDQGNPPEEILRHPSIDPLLPLVFRHAEGPTLPIELQRIGDVLEARAAYRKDRFIQRTTLGLFIGMALFGLGAIIVMLLPYFSSMWSLQ